MLTKKMIHNCIKNINGAIEHTEQKDSSTNYSERSKRGYMLLLNGNELTEKFSIGELAEFLDVTYDAISKLRQKRITTLSKKGYSVEKIALDGTIIKNNH